LIAWWIDQDRDSPGFGQAIPERSGIVRWFARIDGQVHWGETADEVRDRFPGSEPKTFTFIHSNLADNPALTRVDPGYRSNLMALDPVEQARLLGGNWKAKATAGNLFQRGWVKVVDVHPPFVRQVRAWDFAATRPSVENPDPDWTVGIKGGVTAGGQIVI